MKCPNCGASDWSAVINLRRHYAGIDLEPDADGEIVVEYSGWGDRIDDTVVAVICDACDTEYLPKGDKLVELDLTPMQYRVARLSDRTAEEIAEELNMNVRTVRAHLDAVRAFLGVSNKREILRALNDKSPG